METGLELYALLRQHQLQESYPRTYAESERLVFTEPASVPSFFGALAGLLRFRSAKPAPTVHVEPIVLERAA